MRVHCLKHIAFEGLGSIENYLNKDGHSISYTHLYNNQKLPNLDDVDFLIIMGGPMSIYDETDYPWLKEEKQFILNAIKKNKIILGVCLGAQLIANVMKANVYQGQYKEIGWFPVTAHPHKTTAFQFPENFQAFHWHGETFDLPTNATLLASSHICKNQAFQISSSIIALQFHLETTPTSASDICQHCANELIDNPYIQSKAQILNANAKDYQQLNIIMNQILDYLIKT